MLICTAHELSILLKQIGHDGDLSALFAMGIQAIIETHGVDGSIIRTKESGTKVPAVLTDKVVDPVGAGDGFAGGVATGLAFGWSLEDAARLGAAVSSFIIEAVGCQTNQPTMEQVIIRLAEHGMSIPATT
jgi:ribokinase